MKIPFRPLGKVREIVQAAEFDVAYAYDDLVFSDHSMFVLRFDDDVPSKLHLYFNVECDTSEAARMEKLLVTAGQVGEMNIVNAGKFEVKQVDDKEELEVVFFQ